MLPSSRSCASYRCAEALLSIRPLPVTGTSKRALHRSEVLTPKKRRHRHLDCSGSLGSAESPPASTRRSLTIHVYRNPGQAAIPEQHDAPASEPNRDIFATPLGCAETGKQSPPPPVSARLAVAAITRGSPRILPEFRPRANGAPLAEPSAREFSIANRRFGFNLVRAAASVLGKARQFC
jgi:hypothetical protein